jgi:hypothetical protein
MDRSSENAHVMVNSTTDGYILTLQESNADCRICMFLGNRSNGHRRTAGRSG